MGEVVFCMLKDTALVEHKYHLWQYIGTFGTYPTEPNLLIHAQRPGRLFSPIDVRKKLYRHFLLHFPFGMADTETRFRSYTRFNKLHS